MNKKLYEKLEYIDKKADKTSADLEFLRDYVSPVLDKYKDVLGEEAELSV